VIFVSLFDKIEASVGLSAVVERRKPFVYKFEQFVVDSIQIEGCYQLEYGKQKQTEIGEEYIENNHRPDT
jgi:hypothetical protein